MPRTNAVAAPTNQPVKNQRTAAVMRFFMPRTMPLPETAINNPFGDPKVRGVMPPGTGRKVV